MIPTFISAARYRKKLKSENFLFLVPQVKLASAEGDSPQHGLPSSRTLCCSCSRRTDPDGGRLLFAVGHREERG